MEQDAAYSNTCFHKTAHINLAQETDSGRANLAILYTSCERKRWHTTMLCFNILRTSNGRKKRFVIIQILNLLQTCVGCRKLIQDEQILHRVGATFVTQCSLNISIYVLLLFRILRSWEERIGETPNHAPRLHRHGPRSRDSMDHRQTRQRGAHRE